MCAVRGYVSCLAAVVAGSGVWPFAFALSFVFAFAFAFAFVYGVDPFVEPTVVPIVPLLL